MSKNDFTFINKAAHYFFPFLGVAAKPNGALQPTSQKPPASPTSLGLRLNYALCNLELFEKFQNAGQGGAVEFRAGPVRPWPCVAVKPLQRFFLLFPLLHQGVQALDVCFSWVRLVDDVINTIPIWSHICAARSL